MLGRGNERHEPGEYGSLSSEERTAINRRANDASEESKDQQQRSSIMTTAADLTSIKQQDISIDSSEEWINQKIAEAQDIEQKWSDQLEQQPSSINDEEIAAILEEATADLEYWIYQKGKVAELLSENSLKTTREKLFSSLSQAASQAIKEANKVAEFYINSPKTFEVQKSKPLILGKSSFGVINPLMSDNAHQPQEASNDGLKMMKVPSKLEPLAADNLKEVLETWSINAEMRYDSSARKYVSEQELPSGMMNVIRRAAARTQLEREQHRGAINKVALEQGSDRAARFENHFSIRVKSAFGEPLTPELIAEVKQDLNREDRVAARSATIYSSGLSSFNELLDNIAARWESFQRGRSTQYQTIPSDFVEVTSVSSDRKDSASYQGRQLYSSKSLNQSSGNADSPEK